MKHLLRPLERIREVAEETPDDRERHVDFVRAVSITLVVVGHWILIAITDVNGVDGVNALAEIAWFRPLTWFFQVMPLFFFVGGYSNAASLASHERRGGDAWTWVAQRFDRLGRPTAVLLVALVVAAAIGVVAGAARDDISMAAWFVTIPLWFVLAYLAVCALAPVMWRLHHRLGWWVPGSLVALVVTTEVVGLGAGVGGVREVNHLLVFVAFHQLGMMWRAGPLAAAVRPGLALTGAAGAAAIALVALGPYPVAMVDVPTEDLQNTSPPSLPFLLLGLAQIGFALATRDRLADWLRRLRPWTVVVGVNAVILTIFLWHVTAALMAAVALHVVGPVTPAEVGAAEWFAWRIPWFACCLVALVVLVALFSPVEQAAGRGVPGRAGRAAIRVGVGVAVVALLAGMLGVAAAGPEDPARLGVPAWSLVVYTLGTVVLVVVIRAIRRDAGDDDRDDGRDDRDDEAARGVDEPVSARGPEGTD